MILFGCSVSAVYLVSLNLDILKLENKNMRKRAVGAVVFWALFVRLIIWNFQDLLDWELTPGKMEGIMCKGDNEPKRFLLN